MSEKDDGGPAFPVSGVKIEAGLFQLDPVFHGMSLRDWFAGQVMNAFASDLSDVEVALRPEDTDESFRVRYWSELASTAYAVADAMLAERAKAKP